MADECYVILHREPHKRDLKYGPESEARARNRVDALSSLHDCRWTQDQTQFDVWAADFYRPKETT